jgi:hypothetical protein
LNEKNPFAPEVERVPLKLMLDARSFEGLDGEGREKAEFLCELCWTPAIDALWSWDGTPIVGDIPQTELGPLQDDNRVVRRVGESKPHFIGGVTCWSQFVEWADQCAYQGDERDWFIYYASLVHFSDRSGRHYLVTADERLLKESVGSKGWFRKGQQRVLSVGHALVIAGQVMKAHGQVFYESPHPNHTVHTASHSIYDYLARFLISSRRRLFLAMRKDGETQEDFHRTDREALCKSIFDRASDLFRGCDRIAHINGRFDETGAVGEILYDLRATIANAAGIFDTVAVLADNAFTLELDRPSEVSFNEYNFRKALREAKASHLAKEAERQCPLMAFLWSLRNPILHRGGLSGYTLHTLGVGQSYKAALTPEQAEKLKALCGHRHEAVQRWGLDEPHPGLEPSVDPQAFSHQLAIATIKAIDDLLSALADDRGTPNLETTWTTEERKAIQRFQWLSGLAGSASH